MELQEYLNNVVAVARKARVDQSDQLTLGELIAKLEAIPKTTRDEPREVVFDFEYLFPTRFSSWRGSYAELALCFSQRDYKNSPLKENEFMDMCNRTIGETFEGYKGGDYVMGKTTPIWVANYGNSGNTALLDVVYDDYQVILITGYREY